MTTTAAKPQRFTPPDERFWKRYSPHGELPLSSVASIAVHILVAGLLILGALYVWTPKEPPKIPIFGIPALGDGGSGRVGKANVPDGPLAEAADDPKAKPAPQDDDPPRPSLVEQIKQDAPRYILEDGAVKERMINGANLDQIRDVGKKAEAHLREVLRDKRGGGTDGLGDKGNDKGAGDRTGPSKGGRLAMSETEKRMLRWVLHFNTHAADDYFQQLNGLGAVLAAPTPDGTDYEIFHYPPGVKPVGHVSDLNRIYWKDYKPTSVVQMMTSLLSRHAELKNKLGAYRGGHPDHFVAFLPQQLEEKMSQMEEKTARAAGKTIPDVFETHFEVRSGRNGFEVVVKEQTYNKQGKP
jgi:hypothetical protein